MMRGKKLSPTHRPAPGLNELHLPSGVDLRPLVERRWPVPTQKNSNFGSLVPHRWSPYPRAHGE